MEGEPLLLEYMLGGETTGRVIEKYVVRPFTVAIVDGGRGVPIYKPYVELEPDELKTVRRVSNALRTTAPKGPWTFSELLELRLERARELCSGHREDVAKLAAYESIKLTRLMPLLLDDAIEEFYADGRRVIYVAHVRHGRCDTEIRLTKAEIEALLAHIQAVSGQAVTYANPSVKTELVTSDFRVRVTADGPPVAVDGLYLTVRRLRRSVLTIVDLVKNRTISARAAAFLLVVVWLRRNITVVGEPGSGKTTLVNALDLATPRYWRKLYLEDSVESVAQAEFGKNQVRFRVDPLEQSVTGATKTYRSLLSLHRSPDFFIFGEVVTREQSHALFNALAAGLKGMQTFHASSLEECTLRLIENYGVSRDCLSYLDVLVLMRKYGVRAPVRRVVRISELESISPPRFRDIFKYDASRDELVELVPSGKTATVARAIEYTSLTGDDVERVVEKAEEAIRSMASEGGLTVQAVIERLEELGEAVEGMLVAGKAEESV